MKKTVLIVLLIVLVTASATLLNKRRQQVADAPTAMAMTHSVRTVQAQTRTVEQRHTFLAELNAAQSAAISARLSGRIDHLPVHENQRVTAGQMLVRIDDREIVASLAALTAQLAAASQQRDHARSQYRRSLALFEAGGLAREKLEAAEVALLSADATAQDLQQKINSLNNQREYLNIRAPFDGIVGTIFLRRGDLAAPGRPILQLNGLPQKLTFSFAPGTVDIRPQQPVFWNGALIGHISRRYNDASHRLAVAEATPDVEIGGNRPGNNRPIDRPNGSYLTIQVVTRTATGCTLPVRALLNRPGGGGVMTYRDGGFTEQPVTVQARDDDFILVTPCPTRPVAVAAEAKLSQLPGYGAVHLLSGPRDES